MDWKRIISELKAAGYTQSRVGECIGLSQSRVSEIATSDSPRVTFETATALLALHKSATSTRRKLARKTRAAA